MPNDWDTAVAVLRCSSQLVDGIQERLAARGFDDVRPAHGFAFAYLSGAPATASALAEHLSVTKQAAAQLVDHLVERGYLERRADPADGRARLLHLTARGRRCTEAAEAAASEIVAGWRREAGAGAFRTFASVAGRVAEPGRLRPSW